MHLHSLEISVWNPIPTHFFKFFNLNNLTFCTKSGVDCLQENDNNWCNGDCDWIGGQCVQSNCDHEELIGDGYCNDETNNLGL